MGVDISTYRARIGTFSGSIGVGVTHEECAVNFTFGLKTVGAVMFIGMLLMMGGVEQNPGPPKKEPSERGSSTQLSMVEPDPLASNSDNKERGSDYYGEKQLNSVFKPIFDFFGLTGRVDNQISVSEARTVVDDKLPLQPTEAPMTLLRGLMSMNYETRDAYTFPLPDSQPQVLHAQRNSRIRSRNRIDVSSPRDLFMAMFYCCDPMLQSILFEKLFMCKCALPFFYKDVFSMNYTVALWPLRSLSTVQINEGCYTSCFMTDVKTHVISFARLGRPKLSKSTVLNSLILSENTFYNGNCNGGRSKRNISGFCEMFFSPAYESRGSLFHDPTHFLNLRGDLISDYCSEIYSFIDTISDCVVIVIDIQQLERNYDDYKNVITHFSSVILFFSDDFYDDSTTDGLLDGIENVFVNRGNKFLSFESGSDVSILENTKQFSETLSSFVKPYDFKSLEDRLMLLSSTSNIFNDIITTDELKDGCGDGKKLAVSVIKSIKLELKYWAKKNKEESKHLFQHCRLVLTPSSFVLTKQISKRLKKIKELKQDKRSTHFDKIDQQQAAIREYKHKQTQNVSISLKAFIEAIEKCQESHIHLEYFLSWLSILIERETRPFLDELKSKRKLKLYEFIKAKRKTKISEQKHGDYEHVLGVLGEEIETTSFTVQHFFREISQICNSIIEFDLDRSIAGVSLDKITKVYANLISRGATIELIDGDNSYMASYWNQAVFEYIEKHRSVGKCVIVSILGLQSSGKATMLNCMFGLNFETGTGRCTRGINGRLLKMEISSNDKHGHVFVIDSEGLRAPEKSITDQNNFDNELATFVTGIGHVSLMNVSGENPSELHNVLGVVVYALIRLKHAENALLEGQSCMFVHHGVADVTAHQNNMDALTKVLDQVTKVAAKSEHKEHMYFNDVINFNAISQVFYTPEFLQGTWPATRINPEYSTIVSTVRHRIIQLLVEHGRGLKMTDIGIRTENVWDGVKSENFIFSFRNGVEIKIYHDINNALNDKLWNFEKELNFKILPWYQRKYQGCVTKDDLKHKPIFESAMEICESKRQEVEGSIEELFEKGGDSRTAVEWKFSELLVVKQKLQDIMNAAKNQLNSYYTIQFLYIETSTITEERKKQLEIKSQEVAEKLKGECSEKDIEDSFQTIWEKFEEDIRQKLTVMRPRNLNEMFKSKLLQIYSEDTLHLQNHLKEFTAIESLHHVLRDNPDVELLVQYVESSVKGFDETKEVSEIIVYDFIRNIKAKCSEAFTKKDKKWTKMFSIYFVVESSRFALYHFCVHNKLFQKKTRNRFLYKTISRKNILIF